MKWQSVSSDSESPENFRLDNIADALPQTIKAEDAMQESSLSIDDAQMFIDDQDIVDFNYHAAMKGVTFKDDPEIAQIWLHGQCNEFLSPSLPLQPPRRKSSNDSMDHVEYDAAAYFGSSGAEAAGTTNAAKLPNTGENVVSKGISRVSDNPAGSTGHDTQFYDPRNILTRKSSSKVHLAQLSEQVQWEDQIDFRLRQLQCFVSSLTRSQGDTKLHEEGLIQPRVDAPYTSKRRMPASLHPALCPDSTTLRSQLTTVPLQICSCRLPTRYCILQTRFTVLRQKARTSYTYGRFPSSGCYIVP